MSLEVFSAFRSHKYAEMMMSKLYDEKGNIKPFYKWEEETKDIQSHFNRNWLQTEYNTAILPKAFVLPKHPYYPKPSNCPYLK